jgi:hypothetical protein
MPHLLNIFKKFLVWIITLPFFLLSMGAHAQNHDLNVRVELLYPEGVEILDPESSLSAKICFDLLREEQNYLSPFDYRLTLFCNGKSVAKESSRFEPPEGIAIKRTTLCKTFKFSLKDVVRPASSMISLKAYVDIKEADGKKVRAESNIVKAKLLSAYEELMVSGTIVCPTGFPLSLVKIELFGKEPGKVIVPYDSRATTFSDRLGSFSTSMPSPAKKGMQIIAHLYCPGEDTPALTMSGNVSDNTCSYGEVTLSCFSCIGPLAAGEREQMLPPRSPASVTSRFEFIKR